MPYSYTSITLSGCVSLSVTAPAPCPWRRLASTGILRRGTTENGLRGRRVLRTCGTPLFLHQGTPWSLIGAHWPTWLHSAQILRNSWKCVSLRAMKCDRKLLCEFYPNKTGGRFQNKTKNEHLGACGRRKEIWHRDMIVRQPNKIKLRICDIAVKQLCPGVTTRHYD